MKFKIRETVCPNCPWLLKNKHQLHKSTIISMVANGVVSACHMEQEKITGSPTEGVEDYAQHCKENEKSFTICKGFAIARARAGNHANNPMIAQMNSQIMFDGDATDERIVGLDYIFEEDK